MDQNNIKSHSLGPTVQKVRKIMTNLKEIEKVAENFDNDILKLNKELKRVASIKCRLKKQKGKSTYEEDMKKVLSYEQVLKEAKQLVDPKEKPVTMFTQEDVDLIEDYDELEKAIRSIQSKKTNSRWLTTVEGDNDEYRNAEKIEKMLKERRNIIKPIDEKFIRKSDLQTVIDTIESSGNLTQERIVELLKNLM